MAKEKTARKINMTKNHQNRLYPKLAPALVAETMEPGPMEVAARMKPGPRAARKYIKPFFCTFLS